MGCVCVGWLGVEGGALNPVLLALNLTLNTDTSPNYIFMFGPNMGPLPHLRTITVNFDRVAAPENASIYLRPCETMQIIHFTYYLSMYFIYARPAECIFQ